MFQHSALFPAGQGGSDQHARAQEGLRPQQPAQWSVAPAAAAVMVVSSVAVVAIVAGSVVAAVARPVVTAAAVSAAVPAVVTGRVPAAPSRGALQAAPRLSSLAEYKEVVIVVYTAKYPLGKWEDNVSSFGERAHHLSALHTTYRHAKGRKLRCVSTHPGFLLLHRDVAQPGFPLSLNLQSH